MTHRSTLQKPLLKNALKRLEEFFFCLCTMIRFDSMARNKEYQIQSLFQRRWKEEKTLFQIAFMI
jgi:hypothetical protein